MKRLLILDLDETLIHSTYIDLQLNQTPYKYKFFYIYQRPFLKEFLESVSQHFDLAIWSASKTDYVKQIIKNTPNSMGFIIKCQYNKGFICSGLNFERLWLTA